MSQGLAGSFRKTLQRNSPRFLSEMYYRMAFKGFQLGVQVRGKTHAQVWARNSYRQGNWVPFLSDIDLSVWTAREPNAGDLERLRGTYRRLKTVFPVLGEINLYVAPEAPWVSQLINYFELERDPQLGSKIELKSPLRTDLHAATFLLRMLEADIERVLENPEDRHSKWDAHFQRVTRAAGGKEVDLWAGFPQRSLLRGILELVSFYLRLEGSERILFTEQLELYFHAVGKKVPVHLLLPRVSDKPYLWAAFPHRLCFRQEGRFQLEGIWLQLAESQLCWEMFGMLTQYRLQKPSEAEKAALRTHLGSLKEFHSQCLAQKSVFPSLDSTLSEVIGRLLSSL